MDKAMQGRIAGLRLSAKRRLAAPKCGARRRDGTRCKQPKPFDGSSERCRFHSGGKRKQKSEAQRARMLARRRIWADRWTVIRAVPPACTETKEWRDAQAYGLSTARYRLAIAWPLRECGDWSAWNEAVEALYATVERVKPAALPRAQVPRE